MYHKTDQGHAAQQVYTPSAHDPGNKRITRRAGVNKVANWCPIGLPRGSPSKPMYVYSEPAAKHNL
eukprot:202589-Alexandrium_andersonii.AAC.1